MIGLGSHAIIKDQPPAVPTGKGGHSGSQKRHECPPRQHRCNRIVQPHDPIYPQQRQQHHGKDEMRPACGADADTRHKQQLSRPGNSRQNPHAKTYAGGPKRHARPEHIPSPPVKCIRAKGAQTQSDRKGDQHGMDRMPGDRNAGFCQMKAAMFADRVGKLTAAIPDPGQGHTFLCSNHKWGRQFGRHSLVGTQRLTLGAVPLLAGCSGPLSILSPQGPAAQSIAGLWWAMLIGAGCLTVLVLVLVWIGFREPAARQPAERFWTHGMGLGFTMTVLAALLGAGIWVGERLQPRPVENIYRVEAIARQWEWRFRQPGPGGDPVETVGRLHIPAGQPVDVVVRSDDVIHSFWVPRLAGKMDAIPGRDNLLRIEADQPGLYHGRSAEFSGLGYSDMRFEVLAFPPDAPPLFRSADEGGNP